MIVDFHAHVFPDRIAAGAVATLEKISGISASGDGTLAGLLRSMDDAGIDRSVVAPVSTKVEQVRSINDWIIGMARDRLSPFGTLFPGMKDADGEVRRLAEHGIRGVKLHPDYQQFFIDDPVAEPLLEACRNHGLIVLLHAGVDIGLAPPAHATPDRIATVLDRFPGLVLVAAHMGGHRLWDEVGRVLAGRELYFDLAYFLAELPETVFLDLLRAHGAHRVLFASDYPWLGQRDAMTAIARWGMTDDERRLVMGENAALLLGLA